MSNQNQWPFLRSDHIDEKGGEAFELPPGRHAIAGDSVPLLGKGDFPRRDAEAQRKKVADTLQFWEILRV
jgi:hypothetical protein